MRLSPRGFTLIEIVIASTMMSILLLVIATLYINCLRLLRQSPVSAISEIDKSQLINIVTMDLRAAQQVDMRTKPTFPQDQINLRIDRNNPATPTGDDDEYVSYAYTAGATTGPPVLRRKVVLPPNAESKVSAVTTADPEVIPGMRFDATIHPFSLTQYKGIPDLPPYPYLNTSDTFVVRLKFMSMRLRPGSPGSWEWAGGYETDVTTRTSGNKDLVY